MVQTRAFCSDKQGPVTQASELTYPFTPGFRGLGFRILGLRVENELDKTMENGMEALGLCSGLEALGLKLQEPCCGAP